MSTTPFYVTVKGEPGKVGGGKPTYHPALLPRRKATEADVMEHLQSKYGIHRSDYKKLTMALQETIVELLQNHNHIDLGELGFIDLTVRSTGEDDPAAVTVHNIIKPTLHLRFSEAIRRAIKGLKFEKADALLLKKVGMEHAKKR
jgi:nucleoid DNA-binding protein